MGIITLIILSSCVSFITNIVNNGNILSNGNPIGKKGNGILPSIGIFKNGGLGGNGRNKVSSEADLVNVKISSKSLYTQ